MITTETTSTDNTTIHVEYNSQLLGGHRPIIVREHV